MARLPNFLVIIRSEKLSGKGQGRGVGVRKKERFVLGKRTFRSQKSKHFVLRIINALVEEDDKVFLISWGNYVDIGYSLQMIDPAANNKVTELGSATRMCATDDILYLTYSNYTNPTASFFTYNIKTGKMDEASFLKDIPEKLKTSTIYMLEVNDNNGDFYIGTSEYTTNGTIYRFKKDGTFIEQFDAGGMNPNSAIFFN